MLKSPFIAMFKQPPRFPYLTHFEPLKPKPMILLSLRSIHLVGGLNPSEKYESQLGWKYKKVPNYQPVTIRLKQQTNVPNISQSFSYLPSVASFIAKHLPAIHRCHWRRSFPCHHGATTHPPLKGSDRRRLGPAVPAAKVGWATKKKTPKKPEDF